MTCNAAERRKSAAECKIRAYIPIYPEMLLQSAPNQPETVCSISRTPEQIERKQSAAEDPARTVSRYHAGAGRSSQTGTDTALSDRSSRAKSCTVNPAATDTDRNRNRPTNRADRISQNRSHQTGAACHGQPCPDFSQLSGQGSKQPVHISPVLLLQGVPFCAFCEFFSRIAPNTYLWKFIKQEKPRIC